MKKIRVNMVSESESGIQGHGVHTAYVEMVNALKKRDDIEVITGEFGHQVDCDIVHLHTVGPIMVRKLFQKNVKKVISVHVVPDSFVGSLIGARFWRGLARAYLRWFYGRADLLIAVSPATAHEIEKMNIRVPVYVAENSIDTSRFMPIDTVVRRDMRRQLKISDDAFVVLGAGQVQPRKRVDRFVAAARALPGIQFVWVGGMPFGRVADSYGAMNHMIDEAPSNVHFPGIVSLEAMPSYYWSADAFWLPSDQETFGIVVIEAAACGLPIILRAIPDYDDTFAGFVLMVDDTDDVDTIRRLSEDKKVQRYYRQKSESLAQKYDSQNATEDLVRHYKTLVGDKS